MKFKKSFSKCLLASKMMIEDYLFKCSNRISPSYFTRSGKMGFKETVLFMLNIINKSVQIELNKFFELNNRINQVIYEECNEYKTNVNILIDSLKDKLIMMFLEESPRKINKIYKDIMNQFAKSSVPIQSDIQNSRIKRIARGKYRKNKKCSL